jgi:lipopolysaccharide export system protein LptA
MSMATEANVAPAATRPGRPLFPILLALAVGWPAVSIAAQSQPAAAPMPPVATPPKPPAAPALKAAAPAAAPAPRPGASPAPAGGLGLGSGTGPIDITSDESLEMQQSEKVYIARGNAIAKRGDRTLYADTLMAYYRDIPNSSQTEIWRVVADGHVRITTPTQTVIGDHAIDDLDTKTDVITGNNLKLTTPIDVITARDSLEWYEDKSVGVARGDALAIRHTPKGDRRMRGDVLVALIVQPPGEAERISRVDGTGHVVVSTPDQVGTGEQGVYNADTGIATLVHHVTLTRGENTLTGEYGTVDMDRGIGRLLPRPPTEQDRTRTRVNGYIVPKKKAAPDAGGKPPADASAKPAADATQKILPDAAKGP